MFKELWGLYWIQFHTFVIFGTSSLRIFTPLHSLQRLRKKINQETSETPLTDQIYVENAEEGGLLTWLETPNFVLKNIPHLPPLYFHIRYTRHVHSYAPYIIHNSHHRNNNELKTFKHPIPRNRNFNYINERWHMKRTLNT